VHLDVLFSGSKSGCLELHSFETVLVLQSKTGSSNFRSRLMEFGKDLEKELRRVTHLYERYEPKSHFEVVRSLTFEAPTSRSSHLGLPGSVSVAAQSAANLKVAGQIRA
jgi:hypothetical protein